MGDMDNQTDSGTYYDFSLAKQYDITFSFNFQTGRKLSGIELDRYIGSTHTWGRLWDNWNHWKNRQSMTIDDQFQDEDTYRMSSIGHPCSTIQGSAQYLSLMRPAVVILPHWTNKHYPMHNRLSGNCAIGQALVRVSAELPMLPVADPGIP